MSFILDALKKSEKAHQRGKRPSLNKELAPPAIEKRKTVRRSSVLIISAALFLNAFLLVWWLRPWEPGAISERIPADAPKRQEAQVPGGAATPPVSAPGEAPEVSRQEPDPIPATRSADRQIAVAAPVPQKKAEIAGRNASELPKVPQKPAAADVKSPAAKSMAAGRKEDIAPVDSAETGERQASAKPAKPLPPVPSIKENVKAAEPKPGSKIAKAPATPKKQSAVHDQSGPLAGTRELVLDLKALTGNENPSAKAAATRKALRYYELPSSVRESIPRISVSMLTYSKKPAERWISINGSKMREGQELSSGLSIEEITPDGAIFTFQGHRFYKAVIGD